MRMHSLQPLKTSPNCKIVNHLHSASISIDRPAVLRLWEVNSSASIPSVARQVDARFPDPPAAVRSVSLPIQPKHLLAVGHRGNPYTRDRSACAPLLSDSGLQRRISG